MDGGGEPVLVQGNTKGAVSRTKHSGPKHSGMTKTRRIFDIPDTQNVLQTNGHQFVYNQELFPNEFLSRSKDNQIILLDRSDKVATPLPSVVALPCETSFRVKAIDFSLTAGDNVADKLTILP